MKITNRVESIKQENTYIGIKTNCVDVRIYFLTDYIIRIRAGFDGDFEEASYSLMMTGWKDRLDALWGEKRTHVTPVIPSMEENDTKIVLKGAKLEVVIEKNPFVIRIFDKEGTILHADVPELAYQEDSNRRRIHTSELFEGDHFYGFGEKSGKFNKAEKYMSMSPGDALGYNPKETDSLYKHIPFYVKLNDKTHKAVGYFYHNTYECDFNMGRRVSNYWGRHTSYRVDGGDIDLFFIHGPKVLDVVKRYTDLTGKSAMMPKHALGYLGSSMYYAELPKDSDDAILEFIDTAREEDIPISGFQLSSGYTAQKTVEGSKRCVFTWNDHRFKDPKNFFAQMRQKGIVVSPNVKPGILLVHPDIDKFIDADILVKNSESDGPCVGTWWGGKGVFADFTNPKTREFWKAQLKEHVLDYGTDSVWNDNCEYDSIVDKDAGCDFDGKTGTIGQLKSVMANIMCHITEEAIAETTPDNRPFIVCRAGHAGIQQYAQTWAGDNRTSWDTLKYNIATMLGMSLCGVSNYGCDIGGFFGNAPEPELLVRWVQNGIFHPRFSIHSVNADITVTEPWMYPEYTDKIRDAIKLRYQMMPYFYSLMYQAHIDGVSILQPLCSIYQQDSACYDEAENFMVGKSLFVANVLDEGVKTKRIYLPEGDTFYDFYTREAYEGGQTIEIPVTLDSIPIYLPSGAILPMTNTVCHNLLEDKAHDLHLICVADKDNSFNLYEDDGKTNDYRDGAYCKTKICMSTESSIKISFASEGAYPTDIETVLLDVVYPKNAPLAVIVDGELLPQMLYDKKFKQSDKGWYYNISTKSIEIKYDNPKKNYVVEILTNAMDLIGM